MKLSICLLIFSFAVFTNIHSKTNDSIKVGYTEAAPFIYKKNDNLRGPLPWLWDKIAEENQFHFELEPIESEHVLTRIEDNEFDLAIFPLSITSERSQNLNFSVPFYLAYSGIMTKDLSSWGQAILFLKTFFR